MGSLMAGWDSPTIDPKSGTHSSFHYVSANFSSGSSTTVISEYPNLFPISATLKRNRSLTKEEISAYWRSKKKIEEEHLRAISNLSETIKGSEYEESEKKLQKSSSMPLTHTKESVEQLIKKNGWWTKSNWAFLNEPPVMEAASNKYASQFHVANLGAPGFNPGHGISA